MVATRPANSEGVGKLRLLILSSTVGGHPDNLTDEISVLPLPARRRHRRGARAVVPECFAVALRLLLRRHDDESEALAVRLLRVGAGNTGRQGCCHAVRHGIAGTRGVSRQQRDMTQAGKARLAFMMLTARSTVRPSTTCGKGATSDPDPRSLRENKPGETGKTRSRTFRRTLTTYSRLFVLSL